MLEYELISQYYGNRTAKRSGLPLMNHIDEGLAILKRYHYIEQDTLKAFCIHPIVQDDITSIDLSQVSVHVLILAKQYAEVANAYLPKHLNDQHDIMPRIPNLQVQLMLIADKVQNYKDFYRTFHQQQHLLEKHDFQHLSNYFDNWLTYLNVSPVLYDSLTLTHPLS